jgi:hypothetical protein
MANAEGDTSSRFDALPRGNGRWRSRKGRVVKDLQKRQACGGKEQLRLVRRGEKRRTKEAGLVAVREGRFLCCRFQGRVWSQPTLGW